MGKSLITTGVRRGFCLRCPQCGQGRLFGRFLEVSECCEGCGADNTIFPSDDAAPYLTLLVVGHVLTPLLFWTDRAFEPSLWFQLAIWLPLFGAVTIGLLPRMKGVVVGFAWATGVTRDTALQ